MNSEEFAPFESIAPGSLDSGSAVGPGKLNVARVLVECVTLTVRTSPHWITLGLLSGGLMAMIGYFMPEVDSGTAIFVMVVPALFLLPATLAGTYRILLACKRKEKLSFVASLGYGLSRSVHMVATGVVLNLTFWIVYSLMALTVSGLCASESGTYLGFPLGMLSLMFAVYLCLRWQLAAVVCVLENRSFFQVLRRSYALSEGRLGRLTLTTVGAGFLYYLVVCLAEIGAKTWLFATDPPRGTAQYYALFLAIVYLLAGLLPLTANFLCYYYLSGGPLDSSAPPGASDDPIGLSRE